MPPFHQFISCDWGTSSFRARLARWADGGILDEIQSAMGIRTFRTGLANSDSPAARARAFHDYLAGQVLSLLERNRSVSTDVPLVISGMASSSIGWMELPYADVPFSLDGSNAVVRELDWNLDKGSANRSHALLVSGVATRHDIMRGEETELIGILSHPSLANLTSGCRVVLPGTHSKHATIEGGRMVSFHTYMSGELFDVLCHHSILRFTTGESDQPVDKDSFQAGVRAARDVGLARALFQTRTRSVLHGHPAASNRDFLSGILVGSEMIDLLSCPSRTPVLVVATENRSQRYAMAAESLGQFGQLLTINQSQLDQAVVLGQRRILEQWERSRCP